MTNRFYAQEDIEKPTVEVDSLLFSPTSNWSFSLVGGGKGLKNIYLYEIGAQMARTIAKGHRLRIEVLSRTSSPTFNFNWGDYDLSGSLEMSTFLGALSYEWFPFVSKVNTTKLWRSLKLKGGFYYLESPKYAFDAYLLNDVSFGDIVFTNEEVGMVKTTIITNNVQPFLGFGFDSFFTGKKVNLVLEGGLSYHGKPSVVMDATNMLRPTVSQAPILENNLEGYRYMPFLQFSIQYNL